MVLFGMFCGPEVACDLVVRERHKWIYVCNDKDVADAGWEVLRKSRCSRRSMPQNMHFAAKTVQTLQ